MNAGQWVVVITFCTPLFTVGMGAAIAATIYLIRKARAVWV